MTLFPEFQTPYLHFPSPYRKGWLEMEWERVCEAAQPADTQTAGPVNEAPTRIQSLSLAIGSGDDRQQECPLFQFHL